MTKTDIEQLRAESARLSSYTHAPSTMRDYAFDWKVFGAWCAGAGRDPLPASPETVLLFLTSVITSGRKTATARRRASAINHYHRLAGFPHPADGQVRALISGARRERCEQPSPKVPLTLAQMRAICSKTWQKRDRKSVRDHSILTLGFCSALRRSNLVALVLDDVWFVDRGLVLHVKREKNDQQGEGRYIGIALGVHPETCPVHSLERWLDLRGKAPGPLYTPVRGEARHMHPEVVALTVKAAVATIGLARADYAGHSMRSGFITEAIDGGASSAVVARQSGHRSLDSVMRYYRSADIFRANPTVGM